MSNVGVISIKICPLKYNETLTLYKVSLPGTKKTGNISHMLASLHWPPVKFKIQFKLLLITYKVLNKQGSSYSKDLIALF